MEEFLKLENLFKEVQGILNEEDREAFQFIFDRAGAEACLGFLDAPDFMAVMLDKNKEHGRIEESKLSDFFQAYEQKMLGSGGDA